MDNSFIDLCDSDDDDNIQVTTATSYRNGNVSSKSKTTQQKIYNFNSPSSSSSSSSDEELWHAGGFFKNKPKQVEAVRKGNYFKEVKEKCNSYGHSSNAEKKQKSAASSSLKRGGIKRQNDNLDNGEDEEFDEDVPSSPFKKKRDTKNNNADNEIKIKSKAVGTIECIEIDLSSSDDDEINDNSKRSTKSKVDDESPFRIRKRSFETNNTNHDDDIVASKPPAKEKVHNPYKTNSYKNDDNDEDSKRENDDDDSSTTIPMPESESFPARAAVRQQKVCEEIDLSMDMSEEDDIDFNNNDRCSKNEDVVAMNDIQSSDDSSSDDGDKKPRHKKNFNVKPAAAATKSRNDLIDLDSDDSSSDDSLNLLTPCPIKKKKEGNTQKRKTSFNIDTNFANSSKKKCPDSTKSNTSTTSSKLLTPRAFSPATTSPFTSTFAAATAARQRVPTPAIPAMSAALVKEIGGKLYPDLTHNFIIALTSQARRARHNSYQRASFDSALRSIVVIALHMRPLRSVEATRRMKGVGGTFFDLLKDSVSGSKSKKPFVPKQGKYTCVAAAALVGMLEMEERVKKDANRVASAGGDDDITTSFPMEDLIAAINLKLDSRANANLSQTAQQYLNKDNLDPGWGQVKKLCSTNSAAELGGPFIKERKRKGACSSGRVFELLDSGRSVAAKLRTLALAGPFEPGPLRQLPDESVDQEFGNVTMSMDFREGGGGGRSLHKMCDQLDIRGVPYVVRELKIADYIFFVGDKLAPVLIERKTADDVAGSLHDGRWERQQRSMRKAQYVLGGGSARRCQVS